MRQGSDPAAGACPRDRGRVVRFCPQSARRAVWGYLELNSVDHDGATDRTRTDRTRTDRTRARVRRVRLSAELRRKYAVLPSGSGG